MSAPSLKRMVFDVESIGLHGEGFAVGYVFLGEDGIAYQEGCAYCSPLLLKGDPDDHAWVQANVTLPEFALRLPDTRTLRDWFWDVLQEAKFAQAEVWTDCGWPVEANFLSSCILDDPQARKWGGPYPLLDVAVMLKAAGLDPLTNYSRFLTEQPAHNPLNDARQSARLLVEAERRLKGGPLA